MNHIVEIDLIFNGYYYPNDPAIPESSGVYCIYATQLFQIPFSISANSPNGVQERERRERRKRDELLYIGQAENLKKRIQQHATSDYPASRQYLYSYAVLRRDQLDMVEAALVFHFKPRDNKNLTEKYIHSDIDVSISGAGACDCAGLEISFRLYKDTERF